VTHSELNAIAVKWLLRATSSNGAGCQVGFQEVSDTTGKERCDAWGYSWSHNPYSVLVEVKVSRSDFLADRKKPHRQRGGVGSFRYFMCPEGLIDIKDLPDGWGLLWVNSRGHVKARAGHITCTMPPQYGRGSWLAEMWRWPADQTTELGMLAYMFRRVGDPDASLQKERELNRTIQHQAGEIAKHNSEMKQFRRDYFKTLAQLERYQEHFGLIPANARTSFRQSRLNMTIREHFEFQTQ